MFSNIMTIIEVILIFVFLKVFSKYTEEIDEEIKDMETEIANLEVENIKLENKIKTISQNLKINL